MAILLTFNITLIAQSTAEFNINKCARLEGGVLFHLPENDYNNKTLSGVIFQYCYGLKIIERFGAGVGAGFQYFNNESFIPIFIDMVYFLGSNKKKSFIYADGGYSLAWSDQNNEFIDTKFYGGLAGSFGYAKKILLADQFSVFLKAGYHYQNARQQYKNVLDERFSKNFHFHMFVVSIGLMIEQ